jgi:hypothetical protein
LSKLYVNEIHPKTTGGDSRIMKPVTFYFYHNTSVTVPDGVDTDLPLDTVLFDTHSFHDAANDRLVVPAGYDGYYQLNWSVSLSMSGTGDNVYGRLLKNGSELDFMYAYFNGAEGERWTLEGSIVALLEAGDNLKINGFCDRASGSSTSDTGSTRSSLSGFMIGAK